MGGLHQGTFGNSSHGFNGGDGKIFHRALCVRMGVFMYFLAYHKPNVEVASANNIRVNVKNAGVH